MRVVWHQIERAHGCDEDRHTERVHERDAKLTGPIDEVAAVDEELLRQPCPAGLRRARVGHRRDVDVVLAGDRRRAGVHPETRTERGEEQRDAAPDRGLDHPQHPRKLRVTVREQALHQRIRTGMHVTDDRLIFAPRDRGDIVRRHLHVDRLKHAGTPARPVIREGHGGAITDGPRVRIGEQAREPAVELLGLVADLWRELHQRPHHLAEDGGERPR